MDSFAQFQVHYGTEQKYDKPIDRRLQSVYIPSSWFGVRGSISSRRVTRAVTALGTMDIEQYGRSTVEYGKCTYNGWVVLAVQYGSGWQAIDKKPINGCIA